jgi:hypothetical protein
MIFGEKTISYYCGRVEKPATLTICGWNKLIIHDLS